MNMHHDVKEEIGRRIDTVKSLALQGSKIAMACFGRVSFEQKEDGTQVTPADKKVQELLRDGLEKSFPRDGIYGEEDGLRLPTQNGFVWSVDPIDGTSCYINRLPHWGISIGLFYQGQSAGGVVYLPVLGEMYWGGPGLGAYMDSDLWGRQELHTLSADSTIDRHSLLLAPSRVHQNFDFNFVGKIRSLGSTVAHILLIARGDAMGALMRVHQWDVAAAAPILLAAGGIITDLYGNPVDYYKFIDSDSLVPMLMAASPAHLEHLKKAIKPKNRR